MKLADNDIKDQYSSTIATKLLKPLDIDLRYTDWAVVLFNRTGFVEAVHDLGSGNEDTSAAFSSAQTLLTYMFNYITAFKLAGKNTKNPYFGCKNIEEAFIIEDLMHGNSVQTSEKSRRAGHLYFPR